jgi:hypothetical protein
LGINYRWVWSSIMAAAHSCLLHTRTVIAEKGRHPNQGLLRRLTVRPFIDLTFVHIVTTGRQQRRVRETVDACSMQSFSELMIGLTMRA